MKCYILLFLTLFISCNSSQKEQMTEEIINEIPQIISNPFLDLFEEVNSEEIHVFSPCETKGSNKYLGKSIPPSFFFNFKVNNMKSIVLMDKTEEIFACFKTPLSENFTGIIVRHSGHYPEDYSILSLYVWDNTKQKNINRIKLTDNWGDGTFIETQDAWLTDINLDKQLDIVTRNIQSWEDDDSEEEYETDSIKVFLGNGSKYKLSSQNVERNHFNLFCQ
jgi:hypothetical protein